MERYKFTSDGIKQAIQFLKGKADDAPKWAKRFKTDLKVKASKVYYKDREIIPREKIEDYLRTEMFKKDGSLPFGRDAAFHKLKDSTIGIPRRRLMKFIKSQPVFEETKAAVPKAKRKGGKRLKTYQIQTDLIFIRKNDLVDSNPRFEKTVEKEETYFVSTVEVSTGLTRLDHTTTKEAKTVTPIVEAHIRSICKALKVHPRTVSARMDKGGEFDVAKIKQLVPDTETVKVAASCEKRNQDAQRVFYRILKSRRAVSVPNAIHQTQKLLNETYNRVQGGTPNELVEKNNKMFNIKTYNRGRKSYIAGDRRKPFEVDQRVRVQIKKEKGGELGFKSYKGITFSKRVYIVRKITKTTPRKYWVNAKWYTQDLLLGTEMEDEKSKELIKERDKKQEEEDRKADEKAEKERLEKEAIQAGVAREEGKEGVRRQTRGRNAKKEKRLAEKKEEMKRLDEYLQEQEDELQKKKAKAEGVSPRKPRRKVKARGRKYEREGEEEYVPETDDVPPRRTRRPRRVKRVLRV